MDGEFTHLYITLIIKSLRKTVDGIFHSCPYAGLVEFLNGTVNEQQSMGLFPQGFYQLKFLVSNRTKNEIFKLILLFEIKSPIKDSFG